MKTNISSINRIVRVIVGALMIVAAIFFFASLNIWVLILGLIILTTGFIGFCPIDHYFHMKQHD